jgi:hypothetical protein
LNTLVGTTILIPPSQGFPELLQNQNGTAQLLVFDSGLGNISNGRSCCLYHSKLANSYLLWS